MPSTGVKETHSQTCGRKKTGAHLSESIAEIVRRICTNEKHALADCRQLHCQGARCRCLPHASLAANENPLEGLLRQEVLYCRRAIRVAHAELTSASSWEQHKILVQTCLARYCLARIVRAATTR